MPTLQIDNSLGLYYEDDNFTDPWRTAPVMLLQHGFSRNGRFWYNRVPILGGEFRILRPDMRGMGRSTIPEARYEPLLDTFAADVRRLIEHLGVEQIVFVGESFGGIIGLQFAHAYPQQTPPWRTATTFLGWRGLGCCPRPRNRPLG